MKKLLFLSVVAALSLSTPSFAWGEREQGALTGILGLLALQHHLDHNSNQPTYYNLPTYYNPPLYYYRPRYVYRPLMFHDIEVFDQNCFCTHIVRVPIY